MPCAGEKLRFLKPTLTIFPSPASGGEERARKMAQVAERCGYLVHINEETDITAGARASLCDTAVIHDLPPHEGPFSPLDIGGYGKLTGSNMFQHVLIVSTGYLPLNVAPVRRGGSPAYPFPHRRLPDGTAVDPIPDTGTGPNMWIPEGDRTILEWVERQLHDIVEGDAPSERLTAEDWNAHLRADPDVIARVHAMIRQSVEWAHRDFYDASTGRVFFSYRGAHYEAVRKLGTRLEAGRLPGQPARPAHVVRPSLLSLDRELLSAGRRWMVLSLLDDMLRTCADVWVYETDDYLKSWWTLGELVMAAAIAADHGHPAVQVFDPDTRELRDSAVYTVPLDEGHRRDLARYLVNTRPDGMGPELRTQWRMERTLFRLGLGGAYLRLMRKAMNSESTRGLRRYVDGIPTPEGEDLHGLLAAHVRDRKAYWQRINHPSHRPEFWTDLLLAPSGPSARSLPPTVEAFVGMLDEMVRVPGKEAATAVARGRPARAKDGSRVDIVEFAPRHLWHPARMGGLLGGRIERLPTYYAL